MYLPPGGRLCIGGHPDYPAPGRGACAGTARTAAVSPLTFEHTFKVAPPKVKEGLYKLTATISHSPTGDPAKLSEMFGYAEATPIDIRKTVVESN